MKLDDRVLNIANEIITSERNYVTFLNLIVNNFLTPLKEGFEKKKLSFEKEYVSSLFDLFDIHNNHVKLLQELEKCAHHLESKTDNNEKPRDPTIAFEAIGSLFTNQVSRQHRFTNKKNPFDNQRERRRHVLCVSCAIIIPCGCACVYIYASGRIFEELSELFE